MNKFPTIDELKNSAIAKINQHLFEEKEVKKSKYGNQKVEIDGFRFDSLKESRRYIQLRALQKAGEISDLRLQVAFKLSVCTYISDFCYRSKEGIICEDVKSKMTRRLSTYRLKKKLMLAEKSITILET